MSAPHTAHTIMFTCIDERLESAISTHLQSIPGGAFHVALAGGGAVFTQEPEASVGIKQVLAASNIRPITDVIVQSHLDCGAYKLAGVVFDSRSEELNRLYADLGVAASKIKHSFMQHYSDTSLTVHVQVIDLEGHLVPPLN